MQALNSSRRLLQANRESQLSGGSGRYRSLFCNGPSRNDKLQSLADIALSGTAFEVVVAKAPIEG
jgi:hypothetical protein